MQNFADRFDGVSGSEIRKIFALLRDPEIISLAGGNPSPITFPQDFLAKIAQNLVENKGATVLQYGNTLGYQPLLDYLAQKETSLMKDTDQLIITSGASQGIEMFVRTFLNEGDTMLVESPTFLGALQTFKLAKANVKTVTMQNDGVDVDELEQKIKEFSPKIFYIIPTFQNPTGITTSEEKRKQIYEICKKHNVMILEDDPYAELRYEGQTVPSIKSYDDCGLVCKLVSFSKTIAPGLRVGYAIAHADIIGNFNLLKQGQDVHTSNLSQAMVYEFMAQGYYEKHIESLCVTYKEQRDIMLEALKTNMPTGVTYTRPQGGLFIWVNLPKGKNAAEIFEKCVKNKVAFVPGMPFFAENGKENTLRLNFSMPTKENIVIGIKRICDVLGEFGI